MDLSEGALKERFETAVAGVSPDVNALMDGGVQRGVQLHRRRRAEMLGAAGLSAAAAAAVVHSGIASGLFDSNSTGPADTPSSIVEQINQPATARSLTAVALDHLPAEQVIGAGTMGTAPEHSSVFASVGLSTGQGKVQLDLLATRQVQQWDKNPVCASSTSGTKVLQCQVSRLPDGSKLVLLAEKSTAGPGSPKYLVSVGVRRHSQVVAVLEYLTSSRATPRDDSQPIDTWALPVSVSTMRAIVTDPRFGMETSPEMIAKGKTLDNFRSGTVTHTHAGAVHV